MEIPDHSTIAEFRRRHETAIGDLFVSVLALCGEAGLVSVGEIAVDGTRMRANATRDRNRGYESIVGEILEEAERVDREEDEQHGDARGDELPERLRTWEGRLAALEAAREKLEHERAAAVEAGEEVTEQQIIVAAEITTQSPDFGQLRPMVGAAVRELQQAGVSERPRTVLADAGYWHNNQIEHLLADGFQVLVPPDSMVRQGARPGWEGGMYDFMRRVLRPISDASSTRSDDEASSPCSGRSSTIEE